MEKDVGSNVLQDKKLKDVIMKIQWDKSIGLGIPHLDEGHKRLIGIFNYLCDHQHDGVESEAISHVLEQVREFASIHFRREEDFMMSINYPEYDSHKQLHKKFREKMGTLCVDVMNHKQNAPQDVHHFLREWVSEHLLRADKQIQSFLEAMQAR